MDCTGLQAVSEQQQSSTGVDPVCSLLVSVMEAHLLSAHQRKRALVSLSVVSVFYFLSVSSLSLLLRLPALALLVPLIYISSAHTAGPVHDADPHPHLRAFQARLVALIIPLFEHPRAPASLSSLLLSARVEACCAWLLLASWSTHYSLAQYYLLLLLCALPLLLLHVHVLLLPTPYRLCGAERALLWASSGCTYAMIAWLLWLSWRSWTELSFCLLFFLPTATRIALSSAGVVVATILVPLIALLQAKAGVDYAGRAVLLLCLYLLSIATLFFYSYPSSSLLLLLLNLCVTVLLTPPLVLSAVSVVGASAAQLVLTLGVNKLLALLVELLLLVLLAATVWVAGRCWPLLLRLWDRTGAARWWKLHVMGGGALWRLWTAMGVVWLWAVTKMEGSSCERAMAALVTRFSWCRDDLIGFLLHCTVAATVSLPDNKCPHTCLQPSFCHLGCRRRCSSASSRRRVDLLAAAVPAHSRRL